MMEFTKLTAVVLISMVFISSASTVLDCGYCEMPPPKYKKPKPPKPPITLPPTVKPPITLPPVTVPPIQPPVTLPPIVMPPITLPPVVEPPPITLPPGIVPPIVQPPITLPPVTVPPIVEPPITLPPVTVPPVLSPPKGKPCPPPPAPETCPIDTLKDGACVDLLGGLEHIGMDDTVAKQCCPLLQGVGELEAAVCLCTTLKMKLLNLKIYMPLAHELLVTCGKTPPPGYTCSP